MPSREDAFSRLGRLAFRRRRVVLVASVAIVIIAGALGIRVFPALDSDGFSDPSSESAAAARVLADELGATNTDLLVWVHGATSPAQVASEGPAISDVIRAVPGVRSLTAPWPTPVPTLLSPDGALLLVTYDRAGDGSRTPREITDGIDASLREAAASLPAGMAVEIAGGQAVARSINETITSDLAAAEAISIPITAILLLIVFGSVVAAGLPIAMGLSSILGSFAFLWVVSLTTDVSVFAVNLVTGLGLGLGIDYSLLIVSRFREELARRAALPTAHAVEESLIRTVATAGRTIVFSGLTVAVTLAAMLLFPQYFLRSFAYAGVAVVLIAVLFALLTLPALLAMLGWRINAWPIRRRALRRSSAESIVSSAEEDDPVPAREPLTQRLAYATMRRPWIVAIACLVLLGALAWPALGVRFGQVDERALPPDSSVRVIGDRIAVDFPALGSAPVQVVLPPGVDAAAAASYAQALGEVPGVRAVRPADARLLIVETNVRPRSPEGQALIEGLHAVAPPSPGVLMGGYAAEYTDSQWGISRTLPWVILWVTGSVLVLLFLFTGSVLLPIKAVVLNFLSLAATLGVMVLVFQHGWLGFLVGDFTNTGTIDTSSMVLSAIVAFGLSMDYEVFLLARIREEYLRSGSNEEAVARGLQRSAGIITAAALLLAVVFAAFITSSVTNIKMLGVAVTVAVLLDATVIRMLLVPAFMRIAGAANWWAPAPLRRLHDRIGLREG